MTPARQWRKALRMAMSRAAVRSVDLKRALGVSHSVIYSWRSGKGFPSLPLAAAVAEHLHADGLLELALRLRTKTCAVCGVEFVDAGSQMKAVYCGKACRNARRLMLDRERAAMSSTMTTHRLFTYREAVARYCRGCEPAGMCLTFDCDLRPVSPLPLVARGQVA